MFLFWNTVDRTSLKLGIVSVYCQSKSDFPFPLSLFLRESYEVTFLIADASFLQYCPKQARNEVTEAKLQTKAHYLPNILDFMFLMFLCSVWRRFFSPPCCGFCGFGTWLGSKNQEILNLKMTPRE